MIEIPRGPARAFRALARKCVSGRPRGPAPPVVFGSKTGTLTAWTRTDDAILVYTASCRGGDEVLVVPMAVLEAVDGGGSDPVELDIGPRLKGTARWTDGGMPKTHPFDAVLPGKQHRVPDPPGDWHSIPPDFLTALHECGRMAARESGRFSLSRVQVRCKAGQVIATDGRTALVWGRFDLPFRDDLLIPALPVFGSKEMAGGHPIRLGLTTAHLVVAAGPWQVFLPVDKTGRYPEVAGIVPRNAPTVAGIDDRDTVELLGRLPGLPGSDAEGRPVTLDLDGGVVVRARDEATGKTEQVRLERSPSAGPQARVAIDRRVLARALALGCVTVRVAEGKPVVFEGRDKTLVTVALDPALAVEPATVENVTQPANADNPERCIAMRHPEVNGHAPNGRHDPPAADPPDPLAAAEELRAALGDALTKAGRLVVALKYRKREQKALTQVWSSLKALNLGPGGQP